MTDFHRHFAEMPLVAILRGVCPAEIEEIGDVLVEHGFTLIEVPLNSPEPFSSIARLARRLGDRATIGAGTVLTVKDVKRLNDVGGKMVVSPNVNTDVITATVNAGMISMPGYFTPSEAFTAMAAGATALKLFPAEAASPAVLKAQRAVLPPDVPVLAVGGITPAAMAPWLAAGISGFGLGSALYSPGTHSRVVGRAAKAFVETMKMHCCKTSALR